MNKEDIEKKQNQKTKVSLVFHLLSVVSHDSLQIRTHTEQIFFLPWHNRQTSINFFFFLLKYPQEKNGRKKNTTFKFLGKTKFMH